MITLTFYYGTEIINVIIRGSSVTFVTSTFGSKEATIEQLRLSQSGIIKEHPDLKDRADWREEAIKRYKEKIGNMKNETEISDYVILELSKNGYTPKFKQVNGFRRIALHEL